MKAIIILLASALALGGCTSINSRNSSLVGSFAGASTARNAGTAAIGNGLVGGPMGASLDPSDRRLALEAEYQALEYTHAGRPVSWTGTNGGVAGEVVAYQPYRVGSQDCRQYMHTVNVDGRSQTMRGAACRNEDGSWSLLT
ncbi:MAG: RT0821/Lpp0805 family surface protein [Rhizobiaceae bacterium]